MDLNILGQRECRIPQTTMANPAYMSSIPDLPKNVMNPASSLHHEKLISSHPAIDDERKKRDARVPRTPIKVLKERFPHFFHLCVLPVPPLGQNPDLSPCLVVLAVGPKTVLRRQEHRSGREHDGGIVGAVLMVERFQVVDDELHKGMSSLRNHHVV